MSNVFGYELSELASHPISKLLGATYSCEHCPHTKQNANRVESDSQIVSDFARIQGNRKTGEEIALETSVSTWNFEQEKYYAVSIRDITQEEKKSRLIHQTVEELTRSNRDLDDFAYIASHDLRSPLRNIHNLASWVIEDAGEALPEDCNHHLSRLKERISVMERLLDDLLEYSRAGRIKDKITLVDLESVFEEILDSLGTSQEITVTVNLETKTLETLKVPLSTCLRNLIDNAIKYHDKQKGEIKVSSISDDEFCCFKIVDNGPGIAPEFHDRIFKVFQTLQPKGNDGSGSGAGLAIVKKTVESYSGKVELESQPGHGSSFRLYWPKTINKGDFSAKEATKARSVFSD